MDWWQAMILGLVEGLTEYLPVSSTGHLILAQRLMGIDHDTAADAYAICIQAGAIVAVLGLYWRRVKQVALGALGRHGQGRRLLLNLLAGFVPAMVFGLLLNKAIKAHLFGLWPIVGAWFVGGVAILLVGRYKRNQHTSITTTEGEAPREEVGFDLTELTWKLALVIGFAQCFAMWPGTSRSLVTIVAGLLVGMRLASAVEFSFLLGVITLGAATCYDGMKHGREMLDSYGIIALLIGFFFAFISAVFAIKWMVAYLQRHSLQIFGWYRVALAVVVAVFDFDKGADAVSPTRKGAGQGSQVYLLGSNEKSNPYIRQMNNRISAPFGPHPSGWGCDSLLPRQREAVPQVVVILRVIQRKPRADVQHLVLLESRQHAHRAVESHDVIQWQRHQFRVPVADARARQVVPDQAARADPLHHPQHGHHLDVRQMMQEHAADAVIKTQRRERQIQRITCNQINGRRRAVCRQMIRRELERGVMPVQPDDPHIEIPFRRPVDDRQRNVRAARGHIQNPNRPPLGPPLRPPTQMLDDRAAPAQPAVHPADEAETRPQLLHRHIRLIHLLRRQNAIGQVSHHTHPIASSRAVASGPHLSLYPKPNTKLTKQTKVTK